MGLTKHGALIYVKCRPDVVATGSTVVYIRGWFGFEEGELGVDLDDPSKITFKKMENDTVIATLNPTSAVVVIDDPANRQLVQAIRCEVDFTELPPDDPDYADHIGLWDILVRCGRVQGEDGPWRMKKALNFIRIELDVPYAEVIQGQSVQGAFVVHSEVPLEGTEVYVATDVNGRIGVAESQPLLLDEDNKAYFTIEGYGPPGCGNVFGAWMRIVPDYVVAQGMEVRLGNDYGDLADALDVGLMVIPPGEIAFLPPYVWVGSPAEPWETKLATGVNQEGGAVIFGVQQNSVDRKAVVIQDAEGAVHTCYGAGTVGYVFPIRGISVRELAFIQILTRTVKVDGKPVTGPTTTIGPIIDGPVSGTDPRFLVSVQVVRRRQGASGRRPEPGGAMVRARP